MALKPYTPKSILQVFNRLVFVSSVAIAALIPTPAQAQPDQEYHSQATLISENTAITPGKSFTVALRVQIDEDWHIYWSNPGDTGLATRIKWSLPAGFKAGNLRYPYPKRFVTPELTSYGFENEVWLLTEITPPANLPIGKNVEISGTARWLACNEACIPAFANLSLSLPVKAEPAIDVNWKTDFDEARKQLPVPANYASYSVQIKHAPGNGKDKSAKLIVQFTPAKTHNFSDVELKQLHFFSDESTPIPAAKPQSVTRNGKSIQILLTLSEYQSALPQRLRGVLVAPEGKSWSAKSQVKAIWIDSDISATTYSVHPTKAHSLLIGRKKPSLLHKLKVAVFN